MADIELIAKVAPKNDGFVGMVDADQVLGGGAAGTLPDACVAASNVTQHEGSISHDNIADVSVDDHHSQAHLAEHVTGGGDKIRDATAAVDGLMTLAYAGKLDGIAASAVAAHAMLDGSSHTDSVADAVTRGSIIYGNATPKWDEKVIGGITHLLISDGTDLDWHDINDLVGDGAPDGAADFVMTYDNSAGIHKKVLLEAVAASGAPAAHKDSHDPQTGGDPLDCAAPSELAGVQAAGEGNADTFARSNHAHQIQHSIADNHLVTVDGTVDQPVDDDYARFTPSGLEGRSPAQVLADIGAGDVTAAAAIVDHTIVRGDGGAKGVQDTGIVITDGDNLEMPDDTYIVFGDHGDAAFRYHNDAATGHVQIGTATNGLNGCTGYVSIMEKQDAGAATRHPAGSSVDPVLRIYSSDAGQANDYVELYHDQTDGVIRNGNGVLKVGNLGTTTVGDNVAVRQFEPAFDVKVNLGSATKRFNEVWAGAGIRTQYSTDNVADPPTDAQLDTAFGTPAAVGAGFMGVLNDNGGDVSGDVWLCVSTGNAWYYQSLTKAV